LRDESRGVRNRINKIADAEVRVKELEAKMATFLQAAVGKPDLLSTKIGPSLTKNVIKRENVDLAWPTAGPGSQTMPMEIDDDDKGNNNDQVGGCGYVFYGYHLLPS